MAQWPALARELVAERYGVLVGYSRLMGGRPDAEARVNDALAATFARPRGLNSVGVAEAYVRRAIVTRYVDGARRSSRTKRGSTADVAVSLGSHPDSSDVGSGLAGVLQTLSPRERACVVLRHLEGMSVAETAATLGIAQGPVERYVADGLAKLNAALGTDEVPGDPIVITAPRGGAR